MNTVLTSIGMIDTDNMLRGIINFVKTPVGLFLTLLLSAFIIIAIRIEAAKEAEKKKTGEKSENDAI